MKALHVFNKISFNSIFAIWAPHGVCLNFYAINEWKIFQFSQFFFCLFLLPFERDNGLIFRNREKTEDRNVIDEKRVTLKVNKISHIFSHSFIQHPYVPSVCRHLAKHNYHLIERAFIFFFCCCRLPPLYNFSSYGLLDESLYAVAAAICFYNPSLSLHSLSATMKKQNGMCFS